jgi:G3E family GTPase
MATPVHIVSGFLGAGKTTAIRAQLEQRAGERVAIIVNDFGEASLDEATLAESEPFRITSIPGGCVCCTAPEGFVDALGAVLAEAPDRLIVEPTGLARPQDLVDTIRRCAHRDALELAPVVVLVDPRALAALEEDGGGAEPTLALLGEQAEVADVLVANRTDRCSAQELERFRRFAAALWPGPLRVHETRFGRLPPEWLEWPEGEGPRPRADTGERHAHSHASTEGALARSWRWGPERVFSHARLCQALARAAAGEAGAALLRFKGIFRTEEGVSRLELAGGALHDAQAAYRRDSRADAIAGAGGAPALERLAGWLEAALLAEDELRVDPRRIEWVLPDGRVLGVDRARLRALPGQLDDVSQRFPGRQGAAAPVATLLAELGLPQSGRAVVVAADGFASQPVEVAVLARGVLLHSLGDDPLAEGQGGPFRLLIPPDASPEPVSCANVKGVVKVVIR